MQTESVDTLFLVCAFVYMAVDAMKKRRSGFLWADAPCLLGSASHGALG